MLDDEYIIVFYNDMKAEHQPSKQHEDLVTQDSRRVTVQPVDHELTARVNARQAERARRLGRELPDLGVIIDMLDKS